MPFFDKHFKKEDLFLYLVTLGLIIYFAIYFEQSKKSILQTIQYNEQRIPPEYALVVETSKMRYEFASKLLASNSLRSNMAFLIGVVLCVLGTMVVVRRLREAIETSGKREGNIEFSFKTSSPGVFLALLGGVIIISSIVIRDKYQIKDGGQEAIIEQALNIQSKKKEPDTTGLRKIDWPSTDSTDNN